MTAKEMFEELGYEIEEKPYIDRIGQKHIDFRNKKEKFKAINFDLETKEFGKGWDNITTQELKAINKQIEELRWNK